MRLYRTYRYGVRLTVQANSAKEARVKFSGIKRDFSVGKRMSHHNTRRMKQRPDLDVGVFFSAPSLEALRQIEGA